MNKLLFFASVSVLFIAFAACAPAAGSKQGTDIPDSTTITIDGKEATFTKKTGDADYVGKWYGDYWLMNRGDETSASYRINEIKNDGTFTITMMIGSEEFLVSKGLISTTGPDGQEGLYQVPTHQSIGAHLDYLIKVDEAKGDGEYSMTLSEKAEKFSGMYTYEEFMKALEDSDVKDEELFYNGSDGTFGDLRKTGKLEFFFLVAGYSIWSDSYSVKDGVLDYLDDIDLYDTKEAAKDVYDSWY